MGKGRRWIFGFLLLLALVVVVFAAWLLYWRGNRGSDIVDAGTVPVLSVTSSSFADGGMIPPKFTCDGGDVSPQLSISAPPVATKSLAWIVHDTSSPVDFVHWVVFNLPADMRDLPEGASSQAETLRAALQGKNDFGKTGYGGPCPPGQNPHHYVFHVYALDTLLQLSGGSTREEVARAAKGHVVAEGKIVGLYTRGK